MININEIEYEIRRLENLEGLLIFPEEYLSSCINYVSLKFELESDDVNCNRVIKFWYKFWYIE